MGIPSLNKNGELIAGEHEATLDEVDTIYGQTSDKRAHLMKLLRNAAGNLAEAGVNKIWIDGSFITDKVNPNDIDGCWEYTPSVKDNKLDPVFLGLRKDMKKKYGLDFFIANIIEAGSGLPFPKFFQVNRNGEPKGIIIIRLGDDQ